VQIDDIDNLRIVEDIHILTEVINNVVDELVKSSTPHLMRLIFMRRVLVTLKMH